MPWFKVDDKFYDHPKARRAGKAAVGVWVLAGTWCADHLTDGFVPATVLPRWGTRADAKKLVDARLWEPAVHDGEPGWLFRKWEVYQPTRAEKKAEREAKALAGRAGGLASGRTRRQAPVKHAGSAEPEQSASSLVEPPSRPDPIVVTEVVSPAVSNPRGLDDDDLDKIAARTGGGRDHAARVARHVLDKAGGSVSKPLAYVLRAVAKDPAAHRAPLRVTRDVECSQHPGEHRDSCRCCAADRLVGDS